MSQEQLADKLGVSRQAVSKWESGSSVPDMEKMMQLCKILNCSLEDLVDDGIAGTKKNIDSKGTWRDYYQEFLDFITKTLNMFWSMRLIEKIKCILEMFFIALILWLIWRVVGDIAWSSFYSILSLLPHFMYSILQSITSLVYHIFGITAGLVLLVHIFKIRYLDYFITIEDGESTEKTIEAPIEEEENRKKETTEPRKFIEKKKNKIIIRDPKHSTYSFFGMLAKMVIWFIKFLLILFAIPCVFCFVGITFTDIFFLWHIKDGFFFFGVALALIGCLMINYLVLKCIYHFTLELKYSAQKIFLCFIMGLIFIGGGSALSFCNYLTFDKMELQKDVKTTKTTKEIDLDDKDVLAFWKQDNVKIVEDNTRKNILLEIQHYDFLTCQLGTYSHYYELSELEPDNISYYNTYELSFYDKFSFVDKLNFIIDMISDKKRIDFNENNYQVTVYASSDTIRILENNYQKFYE